MGIDGAWLRTLYRKQYSREGAPDLSSWTHRPCRHFPNFCSLPWHEAMVNSRFSSSSSYFFLELSAAITLWLASFASRPVRTRLPLAVFRDRSPLSRAFWGGVLTNLPGPKRHLAVPGGLCKTPNRHIRSSFIAGSILLFLSGRTRLFLVVFCHRGRIEDAFHTRWPIHANCSAITFIPNGCNADARCTMYDAWKAGSRSLHGDFRRSTQRSLCIQAFREAPSP